MQRRALAAESDYVRKIASSQSSSSLSFSADACEKGRSLFSFSLIGHIQLLISLPPCLGSGGSRIAGSRRLPLFPRKGTGRERSFYIEKAHSARRFPLKDIACVLLAQTKDAKIVCVIAVGPDLSTHNLKRLASARHLIERKLYSYQMHASNKPVSEDEKADDVFSRRHLYCGTPVVTSWAVAGQQVVFLHMHLQTESRWGRSP